MYSSGVGGAQEWPYCSQLRRCEVDIRAFTQPVRKFLVEVDKTVDLGATRAWLPMHNEHPGISVRAPARPKMA